LHRHSSFIRLRATSFPAHLDSFVLRNSQSFLEQLRTNLLQWPETRGYDQSCNGSCRQELLTVGGSKRLAKATLMHRSSALLLLALRKCSNAVSVCVDDAIFP